MISAVDNSPHIQNFTSSTAIAKIIRASIVYFYIEQRSANANAIPKLLQSIPKLNFLTKRERKQNITRYFSAFSMSQATSCTGRPNAARCFTRFMLSLHNRRSHLIVGNGCLFMTSFSQIA